MPFIPEIDSFVIAGFLVWNHAFVVSLHKRELLRNLDRRAEYELLFPFPWNQHQVLLSVHCNPFDISFPDAAPHGIHQADNLHQPFLFLGIFRVTFEAPGDSEWNFPVNDRNVCTGAGLERKDESAFIGIIAVGTFVEAHYRLPLAQFHVQDAIVGKPGSGKTTIVNLLYRLYRVKSGSILLDDESIYNYSDKIYSSNISGVFQKSLIFKMSIKDNLSLIDSNPDHQIAACKRVGLHKDIKALPKGYDTIIDAEDSLLSDGQTQKLALARALLSKAEVLLLDEVTSNIDPKSTTEIAELLQDLKEDHTIIITTHKPQLMEVADRVVVLKDGKVSAKGTNKEVYKKSKLYQELRQATFAGPSEIETNV